MKKKGFKISLGASLLTIFLLFSNSAFAEEIIVVTGAGFSTISVDQARSFADFQAFSTCTGYGGTILNTPAPVYHVFTSPGSWRVQGTYSCLVP
ncbi:hypothetical protein ABE488_03125 [Luteimonas sp. TWI662]|uniref:hypothetical protein n=1 Tax=Luteimonas sp. TWI662 TaxID=3136789 RepID=UPI0032091EEF